MKLVLEHERVDFLRSVIEVIKDLFLEGFISFTKDGLGIQTMDPSRVSLVQVVIPASEFDTYECSTPLQLGVSFVDMYKIFKCASSSDRLRMIYKGGSRLEFRFTGCTNAKFNLVLTNPEDMSGVSVPKDLVYTYEVVLTSSEFQRIIKSLLQFTSSVIISKDSHGHFNFANGNDKTTTGHGGMFYIDSPLPMTSCYRESFNLKYLEHFTKCTSLSDHVTLKLTSSIPLCISCQFGNASTLLFYLAPKLDDSDGKNDSDDDELKD